MRVSTAALLALCAALGGGCLPSPRGRCARDGDCATAAAGLFCAEGVCQAPPAFHADVPRAAAARSDTATVRVQLASAHGGVASATARLDLAGQTLQPVRESAGTLHFAVPLSLAPAGAEGPLPFRLTVADDLGHQTALDDSLSVDDAPPEVTLVTDAAWHPRQPLTLRANTSDLTLDVSSVLLSIGGASLFPTAVSGTTYSFAIPISALPAGGEGPVPYSVTARDQFGHSTTSPGTLLVDDQPPRVAIDAATLPATAALRGTLVTLHALVDDASPVAVTFALAGHADLPTQMLDARTFALTFDTATLEPGKTQAALTVKATDAAGNVGTATAMIDVTRVRWHQPLASARLLAGLCLDEQSVVITTDNNELGRVDRMSGIQLKSVTLSTNSSGAPVVGSTSTYVSLADNTVCSVSTQVQWCCGPFATLSSPLALGQFNGVSGETETVIVGTTGDASRGGQRLYAIRNGQTLESCDYQTSAVISSFEDSTPAIAPDGTIFLSLPDTIVAAQFDGFSWTSGNHAFPNHPFVGRPALGTATAQGQPIVVSTNDGFVDETIFPISSTLPQTPRRGPGFPPASPAAATRRRGRPSRRMGPSSSGRMTIGWWRSTRRGTRSGSSRSTASRAGRRRKGPEASPMRPMRPGR